MPPTVTREQSSARIAAAFAALPVRVPDPQPGATACPPLSGAAGPPKSDRLRDNPLFWVATAVFAVMVIMLALPWYRSTSKIAPSVEGVAAPSSGVAAPSVEGVVAPSSVVGTSE